MDCYTAALRILSFRFNSTGELRRKLRAKKFAEDEISATLERLTAEKWLDDERFAGAYARTRTQKRVGRLRILRELSEAGVGNEAARQAVAESTDEDREREAAREAATKKLRVLLRKPSQDMRQKLTAYLMRQGFDAGLAREVAKEVDLRVRPTFDDAEPGEGET